MTRKHTLAALIIATALTTNANAAHAFGWNMSWLYSGFSMGIIAPNN